MKWPSSWFGKRSNEQRLYKILRCPACGEEGLQEVLARSVKGDRIQVKCVCGHIYWRDAGLDGKGEEG